MLRRFLLMPAAFCLVALCTTRAQAAPLFFNIQDCSFGDCSAFAQSGGGSIFASLDVVNGNDLLITLTNALRADALNDDPYLTALGFQYDGVLTDLRFESFTVLSGTVAKPAFSVDSSIRSFFIDFGFGFSDTADGRFQAMDPNEAVRILLTTTGDVDVSQFTQGVAKVAGGGDNGAGGSFVLTGGPTPVPEPGSLMALMVGFGVLSIRRKWSANR